MADDRRLPLKVFWEAVEERLSACSVEELRAILLAMAQSTASNERRDFLEQLGVNVTPVSPVLAPEDLLDEIHDLYLELQEEMENAPEPDYDASWYAEDEDFSEPYVEFVQPLVALFDQAQAAFDYGNLRLAADAYTELFAVLDLEDEYGRGHRLAELPGVDVEETVARYLRAVYETLPPGERPARMYGEMGHQYMLPPYRRWMLEDLIQITPNPLPDQDQFLKDWIALLRTLSAPSGGNVDAWLREAVRIGYGTAGLEALARTEGVTRPRAYLDWFAALEAEGKIRDVMTAAQEALAVLPRELAIRAAVADHLCAAAAELGRIDLVHEGRWEAFAAEPILERLLDLREMVSEDGERVALMRRALGCVQDYRAHRPVGQGVMTFDVRDRLERTVTVGKADLGHVLLLAGEWEAAHALAGQGQVLGWSSHESYQGLVVGAFLVLLSGSSVVDLSPNLARVWAWGLKHTLPDRLLHGDALARVNRHYTAAFSCAQVASQQQAKMLTWCLETARQRVTAIVANQHRASYDKAAVLTVACGETLLLRDDPAAARLFIQSIRDAFPRHSAFQREIKAALAAGPGSGSAFR